MNVELTDILTIIGTLGGFEAIKWGISFYTNRKTNARIEDAHADVEEDYSRITAIPVNRLLNFSFIHQEVMRFWDFHLPVNGPA